MPGPLHGIRVLEFSHIAAGPYCGRTLADLGAHVIKVETLTGDDYRRSGAVVEGTSRTFQAYDRGKHSISLNLQEPRAREAVHRLMPSIDIVLTNYRPGVPERLEVDYETLRKFRPDLIYLRITGFGPGGPLSDYTSSDIIAQAYSGGMVSGGAINEDGAPLTIRSIALGDVTSGLAGAMGICAALIHRKRTGEGQLIDAALVRSAMSLIGEKVMREPVSDAVRRDPRMAAIDAVRARGGDYRELMEARRDRIEEAELAARRLYDCGYNAQDVPFVISCITPEQRAAARAVLGVEDEGGDAPRFDPFDLANQARIEETRRRIRAAARSRPAAEWLAAFRAAGVPTSPVHVAEEVADAPHTSDFMVAIDHPITGPQRQVGPILEMSKTPPGIARPSAMLGQHTDKVLREAGYADEEIAALRADDVVR